MTLSDYKKEYQWYSGKASELIRQFAFAGIAVIWIFRTQASSGSGIPDDLLLPLILLCLSLSFDLLQYLLGYVIWYSFFRLNEKKQETFNPDQEMTHSIIWPLPIHICFWFKALSVILSYFFLVCYVWRVWVCD
jgi:hypothetical protein